MHKGKVYIGPLSDLLVHLNHQMTPLFEKAFISFPFFLPRDPTQKYFNGCNFYQLFFPRELINSTLADGKTGNVTLNRKGDRINTVYQIVNLREGVDRRLNVVGEYRYGQVSINDTIIWPGGQDTVPDGIFVSTHLRVSLPCSTESTTWARATCVYEIEWIENRTIFFGDSEFHPRAKREVANNFYFPKITTVARSITEP